MPRYDLVLFDADGTLLDFSRAQEHALMGMLKDLSLPVGEDTLSVYHQINLGYWHKLERGEITRPELVVARFAELLAHLGADGNPSVMEDGFQHYFREADFLIDGAAELCAALAPHCTLAIATNGDFRAQKRRVEKSPLKPYISYLIVSDEAGAAKPSPVFFDFALERCGFSDLSRVLMVGDSLSADMRGGSGYGIDTCWYNPEALPLPQDFAVTYTVRELAPIADIVL